MDPDLAMSSYQFVNSLASCYPQSQLNPQHQPNHQTTASNNTNSSTPSGTQISANDYFPTSAYTPNLYPGTPQAHYASAAYNLGGGQQNPNDMVDYTQLQPQRLLLNQQQQQQQQTPLTAQSCKYASDTTPASNNNTSISSPQDLSTARDISPKLSPNTVAETVARQINKNSSSTVSSSNTANNHPVSGLNSNNHTTQLPLHSPGGDSDTSSESGNEGGGSSQNSSSKKNVPPQIYPWMKRVHLGQSEYIQILFL